MVHTYGKWSPWLQLLVHLHRRSPSPRGLETCPSQEALALRHLGWIWAGSGLDRVLCTPSQRLLISAGIDGDMRAIASAGCAHARPAAKE